MQLPRFRFTLRQLTMLIAALAFLFAALRTSSWPLVLAIEVILAGFAVDRAWGGPEIYGAMLAGASGFPVFGLAFHIALSLLVGWQPFDLSALLVMIFAGAVVGGASGAVLGFCFCMVAALWNSTHHPPSLATGPSRPLVSRGLPQPASNTEESVHDAA